MNKDTIFAVQLYPLNEGQDLNYREFFEGTSTQLEIRMWEMIRGLESTLPNGTFSVKIKDMECTGEWFFTDGNYYDKDHNKLEIPKIKVNWITNASIQRI